MEWETLYKLEISYCHCTVSLYRHAPWFYLWYMSFFLKPIPTLYTHFMALVFYKWNKSVLLYVQIQIDWCSLINSCILFLSSFTAVKLSHIKFFSNFLLLYNFLFIIYYLSCISCTSCEYVLYLYSSTNKPLYRSQPSHPAPHASLELSLEAQFHHLYKETSPGQNPVLPLGGSQLLTPYVHTKEGRSLLACPSDSVPFVHDSISAQQIQQHHPSYINALLIQSHGVVLAQSCTNCRSR